MTRILYEMFLPEWEPKVVPGGGRSGPPAGNLRSTDAPEETDGAGGVHGDDVRTFGDPFSARQYVQRLRQLGIAAKISKNGSITVRFRDEDEMAQMMHVRSEFPYVDV